MKLWRALIFFLATCVTFLICYLAFDFLFDVAERGILVSLPLLYASAILWIVVCVVLLCYAAIIESLIDLGRE